MKREDLLKKITLAAGKETLKYFGKVGVKYTKKHAEDVVTIADLKSEKLLVDAIKKHFPEDGIISEESKDYKTDSEYVWIMDPLDGTWNFSKGIPIYGVLVAIARRKEIFVGAAYFPKLDEFYFAQKGKGATLNGKKIVCSDKSDFEHIKFAGYMHITGKYKKQTIKLNAALEDKDIWVFDYGSAGYEMCLVASGRASFVYFTALHSKIWDAAASCLILGEAGCTLTNVLGERVNIDGKLDVIAANPILHRKIMKIINPKKANAQMR